MKRLAFAIIFGCLILLALAELPAQEPNCRQGRFDEVTDHFFHTASSAQGARGDVVAVDLFATIEGAPVAWDLETINFSGCYDPSLAEVLDEVYYTEVFDEITWRSVFEAPTRGDKAGFFLFSGLQSERAARYFPSSEPVHLATVFFRLQGPPGSSFLVDFCDDVFVDHEPTMSCFDNGLYYVGDTIDDQLVAFSTRHVPGEVRIVEGEPTQTEPPDLPPLAKIYPEAPTAETADIHFELTGAVARPGSTGVPLEVYATSNFEFSGFVLSITFPPEHVQVSGLVEHTRPGVSRIENQEGFLALGSLNSRRRIGAEGERVKLVTLLVDVKDEAVDVPSVSLRFEDSGPGDMKTFFNWLAVHHEDGRAEASPLPLTAEVSPLLITDGEMALQREATFRGDVNLDYTVDVSDPIVLLNHLFAGQGGVVCPPAADFNTDGATNVSDPIAILNHLFAGGPPLNLTKDLFCDQ